MNETHDPGLRSWVESANTRSTDFPVQNLPFGVFSRRDVGEPGRVGVAIGNLILDVTLLSTVSWRWGPNIGLRYASD
jgi:fumarylacetoacetase